MYIAVMDGNKHLWFYSFIPEDGGTWSSSHKLGQASFDDVNNGWTGMLDSHDVTFDSLEELSNPGLYVAYFHRRVPVELFANEHDAFEAYH